MADYIITKTSFLTHSIQVTKKKSNIWCTFILVLWICFIFYKKIKQIHNFVKNYKKCNLASLFGGTTKWDRTNKLT